MTSKSKINLETAVRKVFNDQIKNEKRCEVYEHSSGAVIRYSAPKAVLELSVSPHPYYSRITEARFREIHEQMFFLLGKGYAPKLTVRSNGTSVQQYEFLIKYQNDLTRLCRDVFEMGRAREVLRS